LRQGRATYPMCAAWESYALRNLPRPPGPSTDRQIPVTQWTRKHLIWKGLRQPGGGQNHPRPARLDSPAFPRCGCSDRLAQNIIGLSHIHDLIVLKIVDVSIRKILDTCVQNS
jgi:hypothetical protein